MREVQKTLIRESKGVGDKSSAPEGALIASTTYTNPEKTIMLGQPEKAMGELSFHRYENFSRRLAKSGTAIILAADGIFRTFHYLFSENNPPLAIIGVLETLTAAGLFRKSQEEYHEKSNQLNSIRDNLVGVLRIGTSKALRID